MGLVLNVSSGAVLSVSLESSPPAVLPRFLLPLVAFRSAARIPVAIAHSPPLHYILHEWRQSSDLSPTHAAI
jgi:hypothetical protein